MRVRLASKNAFNSANWEQVRWRTSSHLLRIVWSYLTDISLIYDTANGRRLKRSVAITAQGSNLWNASYGGVLHIEMPQDAYLIGYADDIATVIVAQNVMVTQRLSWCAGRQSSANAAEISNAVKYVGLRIDCKLAIRTSSKNRMLQFRGRFRTVLVVTDRPASPKEEKKRLRKKRRSIKQNGEGRGLTVRQWQVSRRKWTVRLIGNIAKRMDRGHTFFEKWNEDRESS